MWKLRYIKIFIALLLSFGVVYKVLNFTDPKRLVIAVVSFSPLRNKISKPLIDYFSKRSYAREVKEVEIYYKGKRIKVKSTKPYFSEKEKQLIYVFSELIEGQREQDLKQNRLK